MTFFKVTGFLCLLTFYCCKTNQDVAPEGNGGEKSVDNGMVENGFEKATVLKSTEDSGCSYILYMNDSGMRLDPINLEDKYKEEDIVMWVKYRRLRMPQRCETASPVELTDIKII